MSKREPVERLEPMGEEGKLHAVIDTPKGSRNKYKWDEEKQLYKLSGVLPMGAVFPYDFGYIPGTVGQDGDPIDVLLLMDEPAFVGCLIEARLVGVIEAEQTEEGKTERNDRLIAVASTSRADHHVHSIEDLNPQRLDEIEHFFASYNEAKGKQFKALRRSGPNRARELLEAGIRAAAKS